MKIGDGKREISNQSKRTGGEEIGDQGEAENWNWNCRTG
jgi:hypothetical protein